MALISREDVEYVVTLARLSLSGEELDRMAREMDGILDYVETLSAVDTEGVPPTAHAIPLATPMREDRPAPPLAAERAVANAPQSAGSAFVVPQVIEGEEEG
jgi:aspartyl-tRNA(Asn)/glutamyl-tRNA(Gln) amidotransferase subunit C